MRRSNPAGTCLFLSALLFGQSQQAIASDSLLPNVTIGELEAAQARNLILEQKVQTARLQQQLRESESSNRTDQNYPATSSQHAVPMVIQPSEANKTNAAGSIVQRRDGVRLQEIYGRGTQLRARILLPNGGVTEVTKDDQIPGTPIHVTEVTATIVRLSDNSELSF